MTRQLALTIANACLASCGMWGAAAAAVPFLVPAAREEAAAGGCQAVFADASEGVGVVQPGPFALLEGSPKPGVTEFHLFYTRRLRRPIPTDMDHDLSHATSSDLDNWTIVDTSVVHARPHHFDAGHVSAPTIVKADGGWVMLYGATDALGRESIGLARSTDLVHWEQEDRPVLETKDVEWAARGAGASAKRRAVLRDPFVMPDPAVPGGWILYFVAVPESRSEGTVVGFARSRGDLHAWDTGAPLWQTFRPGNETTVAGPHAFFFAGSWRLFTTVDHAGPPILPPTPGGALVPPDSVFVLSNAMSPTDVAQWSAPLPLQLASTAGTMYNFCQQTETFEAEPGKRILAGVSPPVAGIVYSLMVEAPPPAFFAADCPILSASGLEAQRMPSALTAGPVACSLRLDLLQPENGTLAVYDVRGRLVRTVHSGVFSSGETRWIWDGRDDGGNSVPRGIYFAQVRTQARRESERILLLR